VLQASEKVTQAKCTFNVSHVKNFCLLLDTHADHTVLPANYTIPAFTPQPQNITALCRNIHDSHSETVLKLFILSVRWSLPLAAVHAVC